MLGLKRVLLVALLLTISPAYASAQATLAGTVKDSSGAVLPGVTVEASSDVLIEKTRAAVTDGRGQYQIVDLRPGNYAMTFSLPGFATIKRDAVAVTGSGVITIDTEMNVGNVSEQVTVTGETPIVDVQSTRRQTVIDTETVNALPAPRGYGNLLASITGMQVSIGPPTTPAALWYTAHGGRGNEGKVQIGGLNAGGAIGGGGTTGFAYDTSNSQEIQFTLSGGLGEADIGGPIMNIIPREGGNRFSGSAFMSTAGKWAQSDNLDDELRAVGITEPAALIKNYDVSGSVGGPILRDRVWFFSSVRNYGSQSDVRGLYGNANVGDPTKWTYVRDLSVKSRSAESKMIGSTRLTSSITPRNKVAFYIDYQRVCTGSALTVDADGGCRSRGDDWVALGGIGFGNTSPESASVWDDREKVVQATWSSPVNNRLLLEAGYSTFVSLFGGQAPAGALTSEIAVTEQFAANAAVNPDGVPVGNFTYRALDNRTILTQSPSFWRGSASYVTGSHNIKIGTRGAYNVSGSVASAGDTRLAYRFANGVPNQFTMRIAPLEQNNRSVMHALYVQDQWKMNRFTLQGALRYEHATSWHPEEGNGVAVATRFNSSPISFGRVEGVTGYNDIVPRGGVAWDVLGNGKTAVKVNIGKYLQAVTNDGTYTVNNKANQLQASTTRNWTDGNANYVPDCELMNSAAQNNLAAGGDFCSGWSNLNFGNVFNLTQVNPAILEGSGTRTWDWQFGASLQQEILPRLSVEVGYNRRWFGSFFVTDNLDLSPADYDVVTITAPLHPNLPDGGGYPVSFYAVKEASFGRNRPYNTFESDYGHSSRYWHGVDVDVRARLQNGLVLSGGTSTGRGVRDTCDITANLPETLVVLGVNQPIDSCDVSEKWLTTVRGLASYTVPKIDVLVSAIIRLQPNAAVAASGTTVATNGNALAANYVVSNATIQQILGRPLAGGATNTTVNLLQPGQVYPEEGLNNIDLRFAKILRFFGTRADVGIDLYNLLNANTTTGFDQTFIPNWLRPTGIRSPRFARFNVTFNF